MFYIRFLTLFLIWHSSEAFGAITQTQFNQITEKIQNEYSSEMKSLGLKFSINRQWSIDKKDAGIKIPKGEAILTVTGGMARQALMTEDAFRLLLCHEVGHVLGGAPKISPGHWSSSEGQADYFATSKCIKRIIVENDNLNSRVINASLALAQMLAIDSGASIDSVSINKNDPRRVKSSYSGHPSPQCRLDTLLAGYNCPISNSIDFSSSNPDIGACLGKSINEKENQSARPRCWYRPNVKRLSCKSQQKISQFGGGISLLIANFDDRRDDDSIEVQLGLTTINPLIVPRMRAKTNKDDSSIDHSDFSVWKMSSRQYEINIKYSIIEGLKKYSLIPVDWNQIKWNFFNGDTVRFVVDCDEV